jgi:Spy/CpxP family protein refolding chaperone
MKKVIIAFAALLTMSTVAMAQEGFQGENKGKKFDRTEMIQKRTDRMVKEFGLNETQAKKLLELNTEYAGKMGGPRMGRGGNRGPHNGEGNDSTMHKRMPMPPRDSLNNAPRPNKEEMEKHMKEMKTNREAYETELKKIMTDEQYKNYQEAIQKRMERGGQPGDFSKRNHNDNQ